MSVEDQHCKIAECEKLSIAKKKGLTPKRAKRGHKPGGKDLKQPPKKSKKTFNKRLISAVKAHLKKDDNTNE